MINKATGRTYVLHVPPSYSKGTSLPLVVLLHPLGVDGATFEQMSGFSSLADVNDFFAVYPDGTANAAVRAMNLATDLAWNSGGGFAPGSATDDYAFINAIVDEIAGSYSVDKMEIYLVGMSNGGMLAYDVAARSSRFKAMASVAGTMTVPSWTPSKRMPVLHIHGTADPFVPFAGGGAFPFLSVAANLKRVSAYLGVVPKPEGVVLNPVKLSDPLVTRFDYATASGTSKELVYYEVSGGGHTWPGHVMPLSIAAKLGANTFNLDATSTIWDFFKQL
jgi:polyhydroxybutyrate depolymerase